MVSRDSGRWEKIYCQRGGLEVVSGDWARGQRIWGQSQESLINIRLVDKAKGGEKEGGGVHGRWEVSGMICETAESQEKGP